MYYTSHVRRQSYGKAHSKGKVSISVLICFYAVVETRKKHFFIVTKNHMHYNP